MNLRFFAVYFFAIISSSQLFGQSNVFPWPQNGNIGIGITTPASRLDVNGSITARADATGTPLILVGRAGDNLNQIIALNNGQSFTGRIAFLGNGDMSLDTGSAITSRIYLRDNGNVGIGTTSPMRGLHVATVAGGEFIMEGTNGQPDFRKWNFYVAGAAGSPKALFLRILNDATTASTMDSTTWLANGNVGIGTTNPTQKLSVNGTIRAKEVVVETTGWSDYVLAKNYVLEPLSELKKHIDQEGHLPGIPSAQEVAEKGVGVGEMQAKLLAKIEELTLHVIEQQKRIERLSEQNAELNNRVKAVEGR